MYPFRAVKAALFLLSAPLFAQTDLQKSLYKLAPTAYYATIAIERWTGFSDKSVSPDAHVDVQGTAFLVNGDGYFVTAAHVLEGWKVDQPGICALFRQRDGNGYCAWFDVLERDDDHDLALCHARILLDPKAIKEANVPHHSRHPIASFRVRPSTAKLGELALLTGYPLDMNMPSSKLGLISSEHNWQSPFPGKAVGVKKDSHDLLQISVSANHGDSGGPVVSVITGEVIGVLLQIVPAPIALNGSNVINQGTYAMSGLFLVAPSTWVDQLLKRHSIRSESIPLERGVVF